jgi:hypothetical protein
LTLCLPMRFSKLKPMQKIKMILSTNKSLVDTKNPPFGGFF